MILTDLGAEHRRTLARHLATRFGGSGDDELTRVALAAIGRADHRAAVPAAVRALRAHRGERLRRRGVTGAFPALRIALVAAEDHLVHRLRRAPTVTEIAAHLDVAEHQVIAALEAGWDSCDRPSIHR